MDPARRDILTQVPRNGRVAWDGKDEETAPPEVIESILSGSREGKIEILD